MRVTEKINLAIVVASLLIMITYLIDSVINSNYPIILLCLVLIVAFLSAYIFENKLIINEKNKLIYFSFLFFAAVMGSLVNLYKYIGIYDNIMHFFSGIIACYVGLMILEYFKINNRVNLKFSIIFIVCFSITIAVSWEIIEFMIGNIFNLDIQKVKLTGVTDTVQDIISSLFGTFIFNFIYYKFNKIK